MANPKLIIKLALATKEDEKESMMAELVEKVFTTRTLLHFAHLSTKSYASHKALGEMYDDIIDKVDEIAEVYMGKFGLLSGLECDAAQVPSDIVKHIKDEAAWVDDNRTFISMGYKPVDNLIDGLLASYSRTTYKLENLK
jgi:hypothetical protein